MIRIKKFLFIKPNPEKIFLIFRIYINLSLNSIYLTFSLAINDAYCFNKFF